MGQRKRQPGSQAAGKIMLTCTGQKKDEMCLLNLEHRAAANLQLTLLCGGGWTYGWKDPWALRLYLQRMLSVSRTRKSTQDIWPVLRNAWMEGISSSLSHRQHRQGSHPLCCLQRPHYKVTAFMQGSLSNSNSLWAPTVCLGPDPFRQEGVLKRKSLNLRSTLSRRKCDKCLNTYLRKHGKWLGHCRQGEIRLLFHELLVQPGLPRTAPGRLSLKGYLICFKYDLSFSTYC